MRRSVNPKSFLTIGGIVLVLVAILGFIGVIGPTAEKSIFGDSWWFDNGENWAHLIIGAIALISAYTVGAAGQKMLVTLVGIIALLVGVIGFFGTNFLGSNLESPADNILHIVIGLWALLSMGGKKS